MICSFVLALSPSCFGTSASATPLLSGSLTGGPQNAATEGIPTICESGERCAIEIDIPKFTNITNQCVMARLRQDEAPLGCTVFRGIRTWLRMRTLKHTKRPRCGESRWTKQKASDTWSFTKTHDRRKHGAKKWPKSTFTTPGKENTNTRFA